MRLLILTLLVVSVMAASASAECAWVLWIHPDPRSDRAEPYDSYETRADCQAWVAMMKKGIERGREYGPGLSGLEPFCLPDTVDPRGPKGK